MIIKNINISNSRFIYRDLEYIDKLYELLNRNVIFNDKYWRLFIPTRIGITQLVMDLRGNLI